MLRKKLPLILITEISLLLLLAHWIPTAATQFIYTISLNIKELIIFLLPIIIFSLLFKTTITFIRQATYVIALVLLLVFCSNASNAFLIHYVGSWIHHFDMSLIAPTATNPLTPLWTLHLPSLLANDKAMLCGILLGMVIGNFHFNLAKFISFKLETMTNQLLSLILFLIPFFIAGFILKLQYDGTMYLIIKNYTFTFLVIGLAQLTYVISAYLLLNKFNIKNTIISLKNMIPAALTGLSTMSSASAMPLTIDAVKNNTQNKDLSSSVVPATVNVHLVGDCIAIPIFAYAVMKSFGIAEPTLLSYSIFVFYFALAKFSVAAVPGGGIIVMLPILESHLGFNGEMLSLITALYVLFDPVITCTNILGNGAFAMLIDKLSGHKVATEATT